MLLTFYDYPAEHWIHLRTSNPIESTFATVRLRTRVTKGPGSRAAGVAMAFKLIEAAQARWRMVNAPHLVALVRAGALFVNGKPSNDPETKIKKEAINKQPETRRSTSLDHSSGGPTDLDNLTLLCTYHHHNFLARGWTCRINTNGIPEWIPPRWVDRDQKPLINTRIQATLTARQQARRRKRIKC